MKIRSKLLMPIYGCILISFIVVGAGMYAIVHQNNLKNGSEHLETRIELKLTEVNNFISGLTEQLSEFVGSTENIYLIKELSKYQNNKLSYEYKDTLQNLDEDISYFQTLYPEIKDIIFTDVFGIIIYSLSSEEKIGQFIEKDYGKGFLKRSQSGLFVSDIRLKEPYDVQSSFIFASKPVIENRGVIGSLVIEMETSKLDNMLSRGSGLGDTGETYIVGRDGIIKTERRNFNFTKFSTRVNPYAFEGCFGPEDAASPAKEYINIIGEKVIGKHRYIPEIDMCLVTEIYETEILKTLKEILLIVMAGTMILFLGISVLINAFVRNITSPLEYLTKKITEVSRGNKNILLDIKSNDEIGDLTQNFQKMLNKLSITDERIIRKVNEQTKEIKQKQKESDKLNKELLKFQEAVKEASDYIVILDKDFKIVYLNTSLEKETGYTLDECIGGRTYDFWRSKEEIEKLKEIWKRVSESKESVITEMLTNRKDGSDFISDVHISPILNDLGEIIFFLTIENDITQETAIRKMKDDFISLVSHELRTPMTVIKGFTKIMMDETSGKLNKEQKNHLERIYSNTDYLINMVNDMLDIEKLNSGKIEFQYTDLDIYKLLKDIRLELSLMCKEKNISISVSGKTSIIQSDKEKIRQVLINLINNAYKFTPEGGSIKLKLSKRKKFIKVEVIDSGIGIEKENFGKIFEKFGQVDGPLQKNHKGTGLGLNICKLIIEKLGGEVGFSSIYNKGTTFYFTLPL